MANGEPRTDVKISANKFGRMTRCTLLKQDNMPWESGTGKHAIVCTSHGFSKGIVKWGIRIVRKKGEMLIGVATEQLSGDDFNRGWNNHALSGYIAAPTFGSSPYILHKGSSCPTKVLPYNAGATVGIKLDFTWSEKRIYYFFNGRLQHSGFLPSSPYLYPCVALTEANDAIEIVPFDCTPVKPEESYERPAHIYQPRNGRNYKYS